MAGASAATQAVLAAPSVRACPLAAGRWRASSSAAPRPCPSPQDRVRPGRSTRDASFLYSWVRDPFANSRAAFNARSAAPDDATDPLGHVEPPSRPGPASDRAPSRRRRRHLPVRDRAGTSHDARAAPGPAGSNGTTGPCGWLSPRALTAILEGRQIRCDDSGARRNTTAGRCVDRTQPHGTAQPHPAQGDSPAVPSRSSGRPAHPGQPAVRCLSAGGPCVAR
jgi:hypothetical protein